jgi:tetratricopeptide (TPR) repeat protein
LFVQAAHLLAFHGDGTVSPAGGAVGGEGAAGVDEARDALAAARDAAPDHPAVLEATIELDDLTGRAGDALRRLRELAARQSGARAPVERAVRIASAHGLAEPMLELLRELVAREPADVALAWRLEAALAELGRGDERLTVLERLASEERDDVRRATAMRLAAQLHERVGSTAAVELRRRLLTMDPRDELSRDAVLAALRAQQRWRDVVEERRVEVDASTDPLATRRALREIAWVLEIVLDDLAGAATAYAEWSSRLPADRTALEGLARCRAALSDHAGEAEVRARIVELDPGAEAVWSYAHALEVAGEDEPAREQYRRLAGREEVSVASVTAALALADVAAQTGDMATRVEALEALAARTTDARLAAGLLTHAGWIAAIALADLDAAARAFASAVERQPQHAGALLGTLLVAARAGDAAALGKAQCALAAAIAPPATSAALYLRASAIATVQGDSELVNERVRAALAAAPDHADALLRFAELDPVPRHDPDDPFAAVDDLLARAALLEQRAAYTDDAPSRMAAQLDRAELLELAGQLGEATAIVAVAGEGAADDRRALAALRRIAHRTGDTKLWAQASFVLARLTRDRETAMQLLRDAASFYDLPAQNQPELAIVVYQELLTRDPLAPELDRLLELHREHATSSERLVFLTGVLATVPAGPLLQVLLVERAEVLEAQGCIEQAAADLDAVLEHSPLHADALRVRGEVAMAAGDIGRAMALWRRFLTVESSPDRRAQIEDALARVTTMSNQAVPRPDSEPTLTRTRTPDPFGGTTAVADLSDLAEQERRTAHPHDTGFGPVDTAVGTAMSEHDLEDRPTATTELRAPVLDLPAVLAALPPLRPEPVIRVSVDVSALEVAERPELVSDDSEVVMLSFEELRPVSLVEMAREQLAYCERELGLVIDAREVVPLHIEAGRLCEILTESERAMRHYEAALREDRQALRAIRGLRRNARAIGHHAEVARLLGEELAHAGARERDPLRRHRLDLLLASDEQDLARREVGGILDAAPLDVGALLADLELAFVDDRTPELANALEQLSRAVVDRGLRAAVSTARAILAVRQNDVASAAIWFAGAAEADPEAPWARLGSIHRAVIVGQGDAAGAALYALACEVEADDPITAAALAVRAQAKAAGSAAAESDAARSTVADAVQLAVRATPKDAVVAATAARAALAAGDRALASHAFARWARCKSADAERAYAAARAAELEPARLGRLWVQVLELDPGCDYAAFRLRETHRKAGEPDRATELDLQLARAQRRDWTLLRAAAELAHEGDLARAIDVLIEARAGGHASVAVALALAAELAAASRWDDRARVLAEVAAAPGWLARDVARLHAAHALGRVADPVAERAPHAAKDRDELGGALRAAISAWGAVLDHDPRVMEGHGATLALASRLDDAEVLGQVLARAQAAEPSAWAAASLAHRRARLTANDARHAVELTREIALGLDDPRRTVVLMWSAAHRGDLGEAAAVLEERATQLELGRRGGEHVEAASLRVRAAQIALDAGDVPRATLLLVRADRGLPGVVDDLIDAARMRGGGATSGQRPRARPSSFSRALLDADLAYARGDRQVALELYQRALEIQPTDPMAAMPLVRTATALRQPGPIRALAREQLRAAEAIGDTAAQAETYEQLAHVEIELAGDLRAAQTALASALQAAPSRLDLLHLLERAHAVARRHGELLRLREQELELLQASGDPRDLLALVLDSAALAMRERRPDDQVGRLYARAIELDPRHGPALFHREALLRRGGPSEELARLEQRIADVLAEPRSKAAFLVRSGETLALCGQPAAAIERFALALAACPAYTPALDAWYRVAFGRQLWAEAAEAAKRKGLLHLAGVTWMDRAEDPVRAIEALRRALDAEPAHLDVYLRLRSLLETGGSPDELAALLARRLELETDRAAQIELHRTLAEHHAQHGTRDQVLQHYRALLRLDPADVRAHAAIADLASEHAGWQAAVDAIQARIALEKDPRILHMLWYRLGSLYVEHDPPQALPAFQRAVAVRSTPAALSRVVDLAIRAGSWQVALDACDQLVTTEREPEQLMRNLHRAATIFARGLGDPARADRMLQLAFEAAPTSAEGLERLVRYYEDTADTAGLRSQLDRVANAMRALVVQDPTNGPAYRVLSRAIGQSAPRVARVAAELADILGVAGAPEQAALATHIAPELSLLVGGDADERLCASTQLRELRHLLRALGPPIAKLFGSDLHAYGVGRRDRPGAADRATILVREVAASLGFRDVDFYISSAFPNLMASEPTNPVTLVVGSAIAADPRGLRFAVGAALKLAEMWLSVPARLPSEELGALVLAALRLYRPDLAIAGISADAAAAYGQRLRKLVPAALVDDARRHALAISTFSARGLARELKIVALRAGLAASGALRPGLAMLATSVGADLPGVLGDGVARELITFALVPGTL